MGKKLYNTEEERLEARRKSQREADKRYRAKNREKILEYHKQYYLDNIESERIRNAKRYQKAKGSTHIVYKHILGDNVYIGLGSHLRPQDFTVSSRSSEWCDSFSTPPNVEIMAEFKNREIPELCESALIRIYGLNNLINQIQPKTSYKPL